MDQKLTVATFNEREPAERVVSRLQAAGFDADLFDESDAQKWLMLNLKPRAHMRVRVPKDDGERAIETMNGWEGAEELLREAIHCPQCHSSRVEFPQFSRRTLMSAFPAAAAAAGIIDKEYYCENCGFTWPDGVKPDPRLDVLNWPEGTRVP